jgi:eukaryotic-like serine/threonine-protein kinase
LQARDGSGAAAEFRKLLEHRGVVGNSAVGALAHVGLARALVLLGDNANARAEFESFLTSWSGADDSLPVLAQVKAEYHALTGTAARPPR